MRVTLELDDELLFAARELAAAERRSVGSVSPISPAGAHPGALWSLAWDSHVHHGAIRRWFADKSPDGWGTSTTTESGFARESANPKALPSPVTVDAAREVLTALLDLDDHRFLVDDGSPTDADALGRRATAR